MERGRETWWDGRPQAQRRSAAPAAAAAAPSASAGAVAASDDAAGSVHAVVVEYLPTWAHVMPRHWYVPSIADFTAAKPPAIGPDAAMSRFVLIVAAACVKNQFQVMRGGRKFGSARASAVWSQL